MAHVSESQAETPDSKKTSRETQADRMDPVIAKGSGPAWGLMAATVGCSFLVLGSIGLYTAVGSPKSSEKQAPPSMEKLAQVHKKKTPEISQDNINTMVGRLEAKMQANPNDAEGWRVLGWSYYNMGRFQDSVKAYGRAIALKKDSAILWSLQGEAMVRVADGKVTKEAETVFSEAFKLNAGDVRARYFIGAAKAQRDDAQGAVDTWIELLKISKGDEQWASDLRERITAFAASKGIEVKTALSEIKQVKAPALAQATPTQTAPKGPTAEDMKNAQEMSPKDRMAMIRGMVEGLSSKLKESPDNPDGWIRLMRSWSVLNESEAAQAALSDALAAFADKPETQTRIKSAAKSLGLKTE